MREATNLKISVWAEHDGDARLMMTTSGAVDKEPTVKALPRRGSGLHREVYSWQTNEDVLGGVKDMALREKLRIALFTALHPDKAPGERGIDVLASFVALARETIADGGTEWSESASSFDEDEARRINPLLALVTHLEWIASVHKDQPGISVTAR